MQAAAGGVGLLLCQWAKHKGATVIGTVGNDEKAAYAAAHGCDHPIVYTRDDFAEGVREITGGKGVDVVYDAIGKDTFEKGLGCIAERGRMVSYGVASGPIAPVDLRVLRPLSGSVACGGHWSGSSGHARTDDKCELGSWQLTPLPSPHTPVKGNRKHTNVPRTVAEGTGVSVTCGAMDVFPGAFLASGWVFRQRGF